MSFDTFKQKLEAYGSNPARWPEKDRALFAEHSATREGQIEIAQAERLDAALRATDKPSQVSTAFAARIHAIAEAPPAGFSPAERRAALSFVVCCLLLIIGGFLIGVQAGYDDATSDDDFAQTANYLLG